MPDPFPRSIKITGDGSRAGTKVYFVTEDDELDITHLIRKVEFWQTPRGWPQVSLRVIEPQLDVLGIPRLEDLDDLKKLGQAAEERLEEEFAYPEVN